MVREVAYILSNLLPLPSLKNFNPDLKTSNSSLKTFNTRLKNFQFKIKKNLDLKTFKSIFKTFNLHLKVFNSNLKILTQIWKFPTHIWKFSTQIWKLLSQNLKSINSNSKFLTPWSTTHYDTVWLLWQILHMDTWTCNDENICYLNKKTKYQNKSRALTLLKKIVKIEKRIEYLLTSIWHIHWLSLTMLLITIHAVMQVFLNTSGHKSRSF